MDATLSNHANHDLNGADPLRQELQTKLDAVQSVADLTPFIEKLITLDALKAQLSTALDQQAAAAKKDDVASPSVLQSLSSALQSLEDEKAKKKMNPRKVDDDAKSTPENGGFVAAANGNCPPVDIRSRDHSAAMYRSNGPPAWSTSICYNCNQKGHFARECPMRKDNGAPRGGSGGGGGSGAMGGMARSRPRHLRPFSGGVGNSNVRCYHCGKDGHFARDCPEESNQELNEKCFRCGKTGHWARDCDKPRPQGMSNNFPTAGDRCHRCGKEGHWARDCDLPYQATSRSGDKCNRCGETGHWARDCALPRNDGYAGGRDEYQ